MVIVKDEEQYRLGKVTLISIDVYVGQVNSILTPARILGKVFCITVPVDNIIEGTMFQMTKGGFIPSNMRKLLKTYL